MCDGMDAIFIVDNGHFEWELKLLCHAAEAESGSSDFFEKLVRVL
jgi:hypothetical protein